MKKIFLLIALFCAVVQGAWADDYGYPDKSEPNFYGTYKDKHNVVVITSAAELAYINEHFDDESGLNGNKVWKELNYYLDADIDMGTIQGKGSASCIGGICGYNKYSYSGNGEIYNCWVEADVSSEHYNAITHARLRGICGFNTCNVRYCCMTGKD